MQIQIKTTNNKIIQIQVDPSDTIGSAVSIIQKWTGTQPHEYRLMFKGQQMDYSKTWSDYGFLERTLFNTGDAIMEWAGNVFVTVMADNVYKKKYKNKSK